MTGRSESAAPADAVDFIARTLKQAGDGLIFATVPAPAAPPESLFQTGGPAIFWTTPGGPVHVGLGAAHSVTAAGPDRFRRVREAADALWTRVSTSTHPGTHALRPRLFGGFSFLPAPPDHRWLAFGQATFLLPRLLYTVTADGAGLSVAISAGERAARGVDAIVEDVRLFLEGFGAGSLPMRDGRGAVRSPAGSSGTPDDRDRWARGVASIQRRIEAGRADKIVAARSRAIPLPADPDVPEVLRRMARESATAARFAFRIGEAVFLGATPERLVGRHGDEVRTEALAGSVAADSPEREEGLLDSLKEEVEHDYVVRAIVEALDPLCASLEYPDEPRVQRLRHVLHLQTPFIGRLARPVHVLELVERMHPTPAVGGRPTGEALEWIDREEPGSRGWYAAPVGWFDDRGDGEFGVALRSALLRGRLAHLFAGAGIVRDSDAAAEYEETEVKLRTMRDALGDLPPESAP